MGQAKFTHRSDADAVIYLQQKIFREKVIECQHLVLEGLPAQEILALARALPHYENLKSLTVTRFQCGEEEATSLGKARDMSVMVVLVDASCVTLDGKTTLPCPQKTWRPAGFGITSSGGA